MALTKATYRMIEGISSNVLDFIPASEHAAIQNGTSTYNASANIQAAFNASSSLYFPNGTYVIGSQITWPNSLNSIFGNDSNSCIIKADGSLDANMIYAVDVDGIEISNITFEHNNDVVTPTFASANDENIITGYRSYNIYIDNCKFYKAQNRFIRLDTQSGTNVKNVTITNCYFQDGSKGGISLARWGENVIVQNNKFLNCVNSTIGGVIFEKSISILGVDTVLIDGNNVEQTNLDGAAIIVEYGSRFSTHATITRNKILYATINPASGNNIKVVANHVNVEGNYCRRAGSSSIYIAGCSYFNVMNNVCLYPNDNGIVLEVDNGSYGTTNWADGLVSNNIIINANERNNAAGTPAGGGADSASYGILASSNGDNVDIIGNRFIDLGNFFNGIIVGCNNYRIMDNDLSKLHASKISIDNSNSSTSYYWKISNNKGAQTTNQGLGTISSGNSSVTITADILGETLDYVTATCRGPWSGSGVYLSVTDAAADDFIIVWRDSSHNAANVSSDEEFYWKVSTEENAHGRFGKTTR